MNPFTPVYRSIIGRTTEVPVPEGIPRADADGDLDDWVSVATTDVRGKVFLSGLAKALAGTDADSAMTPADVAAAIAQFGGNVYVKALWFASINSGTSGTISAPTGGTIILDQWAAGVDALASNISGGLPDFTSPLTAGGAVITATLDSSGNWTLSGTPASYPVALIYVYKVAFANFNADQSIGGLELTQGVMNSLATAANDFIVAQGPGVFVGKTLAQTLTILGKGAASGLATLNASSKVVENPANATSTATASKIPIADGSGKLDTWVSDATTAVKGKLVTAGNAKALAGTDTASAMTPADVAAAQAVVSNPKAMSQGVVMTYAASGSSGITVADNDNIDFGTGNFTLVWKGSLQNWTPSTIQVLMGKSNGTTTGWRLYCNTDGKIGIRLGANLYTSSVAPTFAYGTPHEITACFDVAAATVTFYADGIMVGTAVSVTMLDVSSTEALYIGGLSTLRYASTTHHAYTFNRALTAAEVLDLYRNGIAEADKWGSQTAVYTSDFSAGTDSFAAMKGTAAGNVDTIGGEDDWLRLTSDTNPGIHYVQRTMGVTAGKRYRVSLKYYIPSTNSNANGIYFYDASGSALMGSGTLAVIDTVTTYSFEGVASGVGWRVSMFDDGAEIFTDAGGDDVIYIKDIVVTEIGATLALLPEGIQPAPGQWLDSSSNKMHAMLPAAGASLTRPKKDFEYRWTNTWTASSAAQYVGGLDQAVLSADHFITDIITQATVTTDVENLTLGDGSDADRFVTAFAPSATRTKQTIAAQSDGTNLKLVYTPAAEATMTVETIIRGFIWEP